MAGEEHSDEVRRLPLDYSVPLDSSVPHRGDKHTGDGPVNECLRRCGFDELARKPRFQRHAELRLGLHHDLLAEEVDVKPLRALGQLYCSKNSFRIADGSSFEPEPRGEADEGPDEGHWESPVLGS